jgi:hypothetical protein
MAELKQTDTDALVRREGTPEEIQRTYDAFIAEGETRQKAREKSRLWRFIRFFRGSDRLPPGPTRRREDVVAIAKKAASIGDGPEWSIYYPIAASIAWEGERAVWTVVTSALSLGGNVRVRIDDFTGQVLSIQTLPR